ncbi:MAG: VWA domain-containing protein [Ruminiclostridium sp.]|nr:VWA domain-containing protein [Ruminiclostridium sp.]
MVRFASWYFLLFIPVIPLIFFMRRKKAALNFSSVKMLQASGMKKTIGHLVGKVLICLSMILLVTAMARPQRLDEDAPIREQGIDIAMVLDVSGSMESVDFKPNRLAVAVDTIDSFIDDRPQDRISFIIFAGTAYTRIPLTLDHELIRQSLGEVSTESVNQDGTAIGMAISVGLNRLKKSDAASRIMVLVTDGDNNAGAINPTTASELAKDMGVKIYTIGVGTDRTIIPVNYFGQIRYQQAEGGLNEDLLQEISNTTGGQYYRAKDAESLNQIFDNINQLETSEFDRDNFRQYTELGFDLIKIALFLLLLGMFFDRFYFVQIP